MSRKIPARDEQQIPDVRVKPGYAPCKVCQSTGLVSVPICYRANDGRVWQPPRTPRGRLQRFGVLCLCPHGEYRGHRSDGSAVTVKDPNGHHAELTRLDEYEGMNPNWENQIQDEEQMIRMELWEKVYKKDSPFPEDFRITDEHVAIGQIEPAVCYMVAEGFASAAQAIKASRLHPAWVESGTISMAMARDLVRWKKETGTSQ